MTPIPSSPTLIQLWGITSDFIIQTLPSIGLLYHAVPSPLNMKRQIIANYTIGQVVNVGDFTQNVDGVIFYEGPPSGIVPAAMSSFSYTSTTNSTLPATTLLLNLTNFNVQPPVELFPPSTTSILLIVEIAIPIVFSVTVITVVIIIVVLLLNKRKKNNDDSKIELIDIESGKIPETDIEVGGKIGEGNFGK